MTSPQGGSRFCAPRGPLFSGRTRDSADPRGDSGPLLFAGRSFVGAFRRSATSIGSPARSVGLCGTCPSRRRLAQCGVPGPIPVIERLPTAATHPRRSDVAAAHPCGGTDKRHGPRGRSSARRHGRGAWSTRRTTGAPLHRIPTPDDLGEWLPQCTQEKRAEADALLTALIGHPATLVRTAERQPGRCTVPGRSVAAVGTDRAHLDGRGRRGVLREPGEVPTSRGTAAPGRSLPRRADGRWG